MKFFDDLKNIEKLMPLSIKTYENKNEKIKAFEIHNPPNKYVPEHIKYYDDGNIKLFECGDKRVNKYVASNTRDSSILGFTKVRLIGRRI